MIINRKKYLNSIFIWRFDFNDLWDLLEAVLCDSVELLIESSD